MSLEHVLTRGMEEEERRVRLGVFGGNDISVPQPGVLQLLATEVVHPIYFFEFAALLLWYLDDYILYCAVLAVVTVGTVAF